MKLWQTGKDSKKAGQSIKGKDSASAIEAFTVGNDWLLDQRLVPYDCIASKAHARMLQQIGVLKAKEAKALIAALEEIERLAQAGKFTISPSDEDCHTAIENYLVKKCGDAGKKIHTARSRNDQVLTALRLYEKDALAEMIESISLLIDMLEKTCAKNGKVPMPGFTHTRPAMPTTVGTWLGAYAESLKDDQVLLQAVANMLDQSPLGSAAGYGVPVFDIDKKMTAKELGFAWVMENPIHAQLSRGKYESSIIHALSQVMLDMNRLSSDLILFSMPQFGYVALPDDVCTGSSIMPQKKNPDVLELVRAKYHVVVAEEMKLKGIMGNLMTGYHRDMQLTKEPMFTSFDLTAACVGMMGLVIDGMRIDAKACQQAMKPELYATEKAYKLVKKGVPFREAYRRVKGELRK